VKAAVIVSLFAALWMTGLFFHTFQETGVSISIRNITTEASMLLKTNNGTLKTNPSSVLSEQSECKKRALWPRTRLGEAWEGAFGRVRNCPKPRESPDREENAKNSENEPKEYLKTKDITSLNDANCAHFACKVATI